MSTKNRRKSVSIDVKRLASYAIAGTAAVGCSTDMAEAGITYTSLNVTLNDTTDNGQGIGRNLTFTPTGGGANFNFALGHSLFTPPGGSQAIGVAFGGDFGAGNNVQFAGAIVGNSNYVAKLGAGVVISNLPPVTFIGGNPLDFGTLAAGPGYGNDQFLGAGPGFIGVKFNTDQFGWIRVNMSGAPINSFTIVDYAYAGKGESIFAGQITAVPEPSSLCLLAMGSVGILAWRRRRAAALSSAA